MTFDTNLKETDSIVPKNLIEFQDENVDRVEIAVKGDT